MPATEKHRWLSSIAGLRFVASYLALAVFPNSPVIQPRVLLSFAGAYMHEKTKLDYANGSLEKLDKCLEEFAGEGTLTVADLL